jgi:hypothetical protein
MSRLFQITVTVLFPAQNQMSYPTSKLACHAWLEISLLLVVHFLEAKFLKLFIHHHVMGDLCHTLELMLHG